MGAYETAILTRRLREDSRSRWIVDGPQLEHSLSYEMGKRQEYYTAERLYVNTLFMSNIVKGEGCYVPYFAAMTLPKSSSAATLCVEPFIVVDKHNVMPVAIFFRLWVWLRGFTSFSFMNLQSKRRSGKNGSFHTCKR